MENKELITDEYLQYIRSLKGFDGYLKKTVQDIRQTFRRKGQFYELNIFYADFAHSTRKAQFLAKD
jgi:hypothetical protein